MKAIKIACIFGGLLVSSINAQEKEINCDFNVKEALFYLKGSKQIPADSIKSIHLLKHCVKNENTKALLLMGRIYLSQKTEKSYSKAFVLLEKAAKKGDAYAMTDLGILYKYGKGCKLNYNKARRWFKKAAELGNNKAKYCLGYLYLKGFGNVEQDYGKAVKWFTQSDYSMAKYWLGVCYYKGYGVTKNISKANELLNTTFVKTTNATSNTSKTTNTTIANQLYIDELPVNDLENSDITESFLLGNWEGTLVKFDWSHQHIETKTPIALNITINEATNTLVSTLKIGKQTVKDEVLLIDDTLYFNNSNITLPHEVFNNKIANTLVYNLLSANVKSKSLNGITYLTGTIENYIEEWDESGMPLGVVLKKKEQFNNTTKTLSEEALIALAEQDNSFIKLYPNPFKNDVIISYNLTEKALVKVQLADLHGNILKILENNTQQTKGDYRYFIEGSNLKKGAYIVSVFVNNQRKTSVIIKK